MTEGNQDPEKELRAYVDSLEGDGVLNYFAQSNEDVQKLNEELKAAVGPIRAEVATLKRNILAHMVENNIELARDGNGKLFRRVDRQGTGKLLTPAGVTAILTDLRSDVAGVVARVEAIPFTSSAPKRPSPHPRRSDPPKNRPLTVGELVAEVLYSAIKSAHKPVKPTLVPVPAVPSRGKLARVDAAPLPDSLAADRLHKLMTDMTQAQARICSVRKYHKLAMDLCRPQLLALLPIVDPEAKSIRRSIVLPDQLSERTVTIAVKSIRTGARQLTLKEISDIIDEVVPTIVPADQEPPETSEAASSNVSTTDSIKVAADQEPPETSEAASSNVSTTDSVKVAAAITDELVAAIAAVITSKLAEKTAIKECVVIRRSKPRPIMSDNTGESGQAPIPGVYPREEGGEGYSEEEEDDDNDNGDDYLGEDDCGGSGSGGGDGCDTIAEV